MSNTMDKLPTHMDQVVKNAVVINSIRNSELYFTRIIVFIIWCSFLTGIICAKVSVNELTWNKPISPAENSNMWYYAVSLYPKCLDVRNQIWRLISFQFVHAGFKHILLNTLGLIPYSVFIENRQGTIRTFLIFEIAVIYGAIVSYFIIQKTEFTNSF